MLKYALAGSAGLMSLMFAGSALAQSQWQDQPQPWQYNSQAQSRANETSHLYTEALNTLYSQGFHRVHAMSLEGGDIHAMALNSHDRAVPVTVDPGTGQISLG